MVPRRLLGSWVRLCMNLGLAVQGAAQDAGGTLLHFNALPASPQASGHTDFSLGHSTGFLHHGTSDFGSDQSLLWGRPVHIEW